MVRKMPNEIDWSELANYEVEDQHIRHANFCVFGKTVAKSWI